MTNDTAPSFAPTDRADVREYVRQVTDYDDTELGVADLDGQIDIAEMVVYNRTSSDAFYHDVGLGQALVFTTAILAKVSMENYSVTRWNIGDQYIDAGSDGATDQQIQQWNEMVRQGITNSNETPSGPRNTASYIG